MLLKRRRIPLDKTVPGEPDVWKERQLSARHTRHWSTPGYGTPPILVRETSDGMFRLCDGHHRRLAAIRSGRTHIWAYVIPPGGPVVSRCMVRWRGRIFRYEEMWAGSWRRRFAEAA